MLIGNLKSLVAKKRRVKIDMSRMNKNSDLDLSLSRSPRNNAVTFIKDENLFYLNRVPVRERGIRVKELALRKNLRLKDKNS